jgi:hypothetical protein
MQNDNPNNMTNDDLEKDMQHRQYDQDLKGNQENVKKTTAAEGDLITPEQDPNSKPPATGNESEANLDDVVHADGALPDPDALSLNEEEGYDDPDKFSG